MTEKIQKILATAGVGSRRQIEDWIVAGRITVNGQPATIGCRVTPQDRIAVDGKLVRNLNRLADQRTRILLYHKPEGEVATRSDPEGRPTVFDHLPALHGQRWIQVGRLDINTSGLLLFTTNGELANYLMHPRYEIEREYAVRILGNVSQEIIKTLLMGVELEDGPAKFEAIADAGGVGANHWYHVIIKEGRQREVRRLWESQNVVVSRLIRVRYGLLSLPRMLRPKHHQELSEAQTVAFLAECGFEKNAGLHKKTGYRTPRAARLSGKRRDVHTKFESKAANDTNTKTSNWSARDAKTIKTPTTKKRAPRREEERSQAPASIPRVTRSERISRYRSDKPAARSSASRDSTSNSTHRFGNSSRPNKHGKKPAPKR